MMGGLFTLLSLSAVMAIASFLAGLLPLSISLSQAQLRLISTIGMGVLVGTSLIVIIPEGVETLYTSGSVGQAQSQKSLQTRSVGVGCGRNTEYPTNVFWSRDALDHAPVSGVHPVAMPGPVDPSSFDIPPKTPTDPGVVGILGTETSQSTSTQEDYDGESEEKEEAHHAWIGIALIAGFILMFLVDKLPQYTNTSKPRSRTTHIALNNLGGRFNLPSTLNQEEEADVFLDASHASKPQNRSFATTIGLVIHAAADGIALGASSSTSNTNLSLVIFFAIMIHKAPAAFGLTSILLRQGLSTRMARAHLVMFSLAAPTGALLTWIVANFMGAGVAQNAQNTKWWTGILLLFSAGTFLYVAMHSMQEVTDSHQQESKANGHANGGISEGRDTHQQETDKASLIDLGAAVFGMVLPLFLQVRHAH